MTGAVTTTTLFGVDFTSAPRRAKPITVAQGVRDGADVHLHRLHALPSFDHFDTFLAQPGPWLGVFDLPFGLPRELVRALGWPLDWAACMTHYAGLPRLQIRDQFAAFCNARPVGGKFAHRACDGPAGSSPSMKWVNPPVAWMLHAGVPRLRAAGLTLPGLSSGDPQRVALEGYPGLLARELIGTRSYKSDTRAAQTPQRRDARAALLQALVEGRTRLGLRLVLDAAPAEALLDDPGADRLDAVLCLVQAAWAQGQPGYGLPPDMDPLEGWIVTA